MSHVSVNWQNTEIRSINVADLADVALVHQDAFPDAVTTALGSRVVECYYRWQLEGPHPEPFASGCWVDGELVGFLFGGRSEGAVSGFARKYLGTIVLGALTHPRGAARKAGPKLFDAVRLLRLDRSRRASAPSDAAPVARPDAVVGVVRRSESFGILSLAVSSAARGGGIADQLLAVAEDRARALRLRQLHLTVNVANQRAVRFYERNGFVPSPADVAGSAATAHWDGRMIKDLRG